MNRKEIMQFLKSEPMKFTYAEIEQMMDEEMSKDPDEMDTDFVDLCIDVLYEALQEHKRKQAVNESKNNKRIKIAKIFAMVAVMILALMIAIPVAAKYVKNDTSNKIVQFYEDHFSICLRNGETCSEKYSDESIELIAELKDNGFENIILPNVLLNGDYTYTVNVSESGNMLSALISFDNQDSDSAISLTISKHKNNSINSILDGEYNVSVDYDSAKQLTINGMDILVFADNEHSFIAYADKDTVYNFHLRNYSFEAAVKIAESIE